MVTTASHGASQPYAVRLTYPSLPQYSQANAAADGQNKVSTAGMGCIPSPQARGNVGRIGSRRAGLGPILPGWGHFPRGRNLAGRSREIWGKDSRLWGKGERGIADDAVAHSTLITKFKSLGQMQETFAKGQTRLQKQMPSRKLNGELSESWCQKVTEHLVLQCTIHNARS